MNLKNFSIIYRFGGLFLNFFTFLDSRSSKGLILDLTDLKLDSKVKGVILYAAHHIDDKTNSFLSSLADSVVDYFVISIFSGKKSIAINPDKYMLLKKTNRGRDLTSLRDFFRAINHDFQIPVLFINSSCIWNIGRLKQYISCLSKLDNEIVFCTDSYQNTYHVQSFFIWFGENIFTTVSEVFKNSNFIHNWIFKRSAVYRGEKQILKNFLNAFFSVSILFPASRMLKNDQLSKQNISISKAEELISLGAPFCKKSLRKKLDFVDINPEIITSIVENRLKILSII